MLEQEQRDQKQRDNLTLFLPREAFDPFLNKFIIDAKSRKKNFSIALIALNRFKNFNDRFGRDFGDEILRYAASTLRLTFQEVAPHFFRYGADEFIAVVPDKKPKETLHLVRKYNSNILSRPFLFKNRLFRVTFSCGIAGFPGDGDTTKELIQKVGKAKYLSRRDSRNFAILAGRIRFTKLWNSILIAISICLILLSLFMLYRRSITDVTQRVLNNVKNSRLIRRIRNIRITTEPRLDIIVLKNGAIFEGYILQETEEKLVLGLGLEEGEGLTTFNKSEIANIKYSSRAPR